MIWTPPPLRDRLPRRGLPRHQRGFILSPYRFGASEAASIRASLVSWWDFEQNNGTATFLDSKASNDLSIRTPGGSQASSVASGSTGRVGRGFNPTSASNTAYIPRANTALDLPNSDWTLGGWFTGLNAGGVGGTTAFLMGRMGSGAGSYQCFLNIETAALHFSFGASSNGSALTYADSGIVCNSSYWYFITCTLDRANNLIRIRVKSTSGANANVTAAFAGALYTTSSTANFCFSCALAGDGTYFSGSRYLSGFIDSAFYLSKAITDAEATYLYNAGSGKNYAQLLAD